VTQVGF
nr:Chain A, Major curlin subunit [Escherichia coli K-12]6G8E_B Chain B, Major curlin subunit [Escherichia coli K-12]